MRKFYLLILSLFVINTLQLTASSPTSSSKKIILGGGCVYSDDFNGVNDTTSLHARGYRTYYRGGGPQGTTGTWFQGNPTSFPAYNGPDSGYVASNFNSVTGTNPIDNWLVLPSLNLKMNDVVSFFSRSPAGSTFPDSLHVWYSAAGDTLPEDNSWVLIGEFMVNVLDVWEYNAYPIPQASANGRIAIRYAVVDGGPGGSNSNFIGVDQLLVFTPSVEDANLNEITSPESGCGLTSTETVSVVIKNAGADTISNFNVSYTLDGGSPFTEIVSAVIAPGNTATYNFTTKADLSTPGSHTIVAYTQVTNDTNLCNDQNSIAVRNYTSINPLSTPYKMGFESNEDNSGWQFEDVNNDGVHWEAVDLYPHTGNTCMRKAASAASDDDWIYTDCLDMVAGTNYTIDYWYMIFDVATGCNLESYIGTSPLVANMSQLISQDALPTDTVYHHSITTFTVPNNGTYYVGFHAYTNTGSSSIRLDDLNLDDGTFIGIRENIVSERVAVYPNPGKGIFYLNTPSQYKNVTVDVFDINGQKVYSSKPNNLNQKSIDLGNQSNGVYTLRIISDSFVENHTIVINK